MLDNLDDLRLFVRATELGSLAAAGREARLSPAAVSKRLARLEGRVGQRLLHRTTRRLRLTEQGLGFHAHCTRILNQVAEAEAELASHEAVPRGLLRVTAPLSFGRRHMGLAVAEFLEHYPEVSVDLDLSDSLVDIVGEGYDLAVRLTEPRESSLIARRLFHNARVVCAAPGYLERYGAPHKPADLLAHNCLIHGTEDAWTFEGPKGTERVKVSGRLVTNNGQVLKDAVVAGAGVTVKSVWDIAPELESGQLVAVLRDYTVFSRMAFYAMYPSAKQLSPKVRAFVDFLAERFLTGSMPGSAYGMRPGKYI